jgi:regulator of sirC expression with transglutaminase-like and TPR domain
MPTINEKLLNALMLIDDEDPIMQEIIRHQIFENAFELILDKNAYKFSLKNNQQCNFENLLESFHLEIVTESLNKLMNNGLEDINLEKSILTITYWDDFNLDIRAMKNELDSISASINMPKTGHPLAFIDHLNNSIFKDYKVSTNPRDYHNPNNFYLNRLFDSKRGITLITGILYLIICSRLRFPVYGVLIPGHFMLKFFNEEDEIFFDPFYHGKIYSRKMCHEFLENIDSDKAEFILNGCSNFEIIICLLKDLHQVYSAHQYDPAKLLQIESFLELFEKHYIPQV